MNNNTTNLILAIVLSVATIFGWHYFYDRPQIEKTAQAQKVYNQAKQAAKKLVIYNTAEVIAETKDNRIFIKTDALAGSINLKGLRFDDLTLLRYNENINDNNDKVHLLSPSVTKNSYFVEIGWIASDVELPNANTIWETDNSNITSDNPRANLRWVNKDGIEFIVSIDLDDNYMFTINQKVVNNTDRQISLQNYGLINRNYQEIKEQNLTILHQGLIATIDDKLQEYSYDNIKDKKSEKFNKSRVSWIGITDKYWLTSFIPDSTQEYNVNMNYAVKNGIEKCQIDFISPKNIVEPNSSINLVNYLFTGAKKVDLLDYYSQKYNIKLFDRAIDFGWFYILTKPVFNAMNFFYSYVGNFGISILIVTIIIKLIMFSLANRSYRSMKRIKKLQPEIERLKALCGDDKMKFNKEVMELYKREKANPLAGCLPLLVQIPVFFSIYKVLYVTIEMRHAPFFGWIKDLSAPDPTSIFNLFGLLSFTPPSFLMIGAWPIFMAITMFFQQKMSPEPADPIQAKMMRLMPLFFLVMFSNFPAGLLIYWSWNNILSIIQQYCINKLDK